MLVVPIKGISTAQPAFAQQHWDVVPDNIMLEGGAGEWNTTDPNFTVDDGNSNILYDSANGDVVFADPGGTVTIVGAGISATGLSFTASGYEIAGDTLTLDNSGAGSILDVTTAGDIALISTVIAGAEDVTKTGDGTLVFSGANTYTGMTTVEAGTLVLSGGSAINDTGAVVVNGGTLDVKSVEAIGSLSGTGNIILDATLTTGGNGGTTVFSGAASGNGGLTKEGAGTFELAGANTYTGMTTVNAGTLDVGSSGSIAGGVTVNSGTLTTNGVVSGGVINADTVNASGVVNGPIQNDFGATFKVTGPLTGDGLFSNDGTLDVSGGNYTGLLALTNTDGVTIGSGRLLSAGVIENLAGTIEIGDGARLQALTGSITNQDFIEVGTDGVIDAQDALINNGDIKFNGPGGAGQILAALMNNVGRLSILEGDLSISGTVKNPGTVSLVNGAANQTLVAGLFTGAGGALEVDVDLNAAKADRLVLVDAGGTTNVAFNVVSSGGSVTGLKIVTQSNDISAEQFSGSIAPAGVFVYEFVKDGSDYVVNSKLSANDATSLITNISTGLAAIASGFHQPASEFVAFQKSVEPDVFACGTWVRGDGARLDISSRSSISMDGAALQTLSSKQRLSYQGIQAGLDCASLNIANSGWNVHLGGTGGVITGDLDQLNAAGTTDIEIPFGGIYGFVTNGAFVADLTVRRDHNKFELNNAQAGLDETEADGNATTIAGVASYRYDAGNGVFISPSAGLSYTRFETDDFRIQSGSTGATVSTGSDDALIGQLGLRISFVQDVGGGNFLVPFGGVQFFKNFEDNSDLVLVFDNDPGSEMTSVTEGPEDYVQFNGGLSFSNPGQGISAYLQGSWREGDNISGGSVMGGGRISF